jgi:CRISPR system Cascade subunit CasD
MFVLLMRLEAPLMAFGREMIDATGPTRDDPDISLLTGLFANALGYARGERLQHQALQDRLRFAVRLDRPGEPLIDFQTAQLAKDDRGWTTRGEPEGRTGGAASYESPHLRFRHYRADALLTLAVTLVDGQIAPTLHHLADALREPARPLFIGRKPCVPSAPLFADLIEAGSLIAALDKLPTPPGSGPLRFVVSPAEAAGIDSSRIAAREDQRRTVRRDWIAGIHAGSETRVVLDLKRSGL